MFLYTTTAVTQLSATCYTMQSCVDRSFQKKKSRFSNGFFSHNGVEIVNFIKNYWSQENVFISTKMWGNNWGKKLRKQSLEKGGEKLSSNPSAAFMKSSGTQSWNFSRISCSFCVLQESSDIWGTLQDFVGSTQKTKQYVWIFQTIKSYRTFRIFVLIYTVENFRTTAQILVSFGT